MKVNVLLFARLAELAGEDEIVLEIPEGSTLEAVWECLSQICPSVAPLRKSLLMAVNHEYAESGHRPCEGDEVAFFPPVSGG